MRIHLIPFSTQQRSHRYIPSCLLPRWSYKWPYCAFLRAVCLLTSLTCGGRGAKTRACHDPHCEHSDSWNGCCQVLTNLTRREWARARLLRRVETASSHYTFGKGSTDSTHSVRHCRAFRRVRVDGFFLDQLEHSPDEYGSRRGRELM